VAGSDGLNWSVWR